MSEFESKGLSITLFKPTITYAAGVVTYICEGSLLADNLASRVSSYGHEIGAFGGFLSASFTLEANQLELERLFEQALGGHVIVKNQAAAEVWEGFVDTLTLNIGAYSITRGPLSDSGNSVTVVYQLQNTTTSPPTLYERTMTTPIISSPNVMLYGIITRQVVAGPATATQATQVATQTVTLLAEPKTTQSLSLGGGGGLSLSFGCSGYINKMTYPYTNVAANGTQNASTKIAALLAADPNGLFPAANNSIATNALQVPVYEGRSNQALSIIKAVTAYGDTAYNRWLFGVYDGRRVEYQAAPTAVEYLQTLSDNQQVIKTLAGSPIYPWDVRPGKWLQITDFLVGASYASLRSDPRCMFIERVSYSMPWGLQLQGGDTDRAPQVLAQAGLSGNSS